MSLEQGAKKKGRKRKPPSKPPRIIETAPPPPHHPEQRPPIPLVIAVVMTAVLEVLDITIVNVALPHMLGAFGATSDQITWVLTSYIVSAAVVMPLTGYLSTWLGRRRLLLGAITGFVISSALCGMAWNLETMVAFRLAQGIFGAPLVPLSQAILLDVFPRGERFNPMRGDVAQINQALSRLDDGASVRFLRIGDRLVEPDGSIRPEIMPDFVHLTEAGYRIWADALMPHLEDALKSAR